MTTVNRSIPGTVEEPGREFLYVGVMPGEDFPQFVEKAFSACSSTPVPTNGAILEEKIWISLPDKTQLLGLSYRGDLHGWRNKVPQFCEQEGRIYGIPTKDAFLLSDGTVLPFRNCEVVFES